MGGNLVIYPMKTCVLMIYNSLCAEPGIKGNRGIAALGSPNLSQVPWYQNRIPRLSESLALLWIWLSCNNARYILFLVHLHHFEN